jgi:hypothetical protein
MYRVNVLAQINYFNSIIQKNTAAWLQVPLLSAESNAAVSDHAVKDIDTTLHKS